MFKNYLFAAILVFGITSLPVLAAETPQTDDNTYERDQNAEVDVSKVHKKKVEKSANSNEEEAELASDDTLVDDEEASDDVAENVEVETEEVTEIEKSTDSETDNVQARNPRRVIKLEEGQELRTIDPNQQVAVVETEDDETRGSMLRYGFQVGGNISNPQIEGSPNRTAEGGIWGGAIAEANFLGKYIVLQTELNYVQRPLQGAQSSVRLDYIELPLHAKLKLNVASVQAFVQAGPSMGYLINAQNAGTRQFNDFDFNFDVGAGLSFFMTKERQNQFFLAARYSTGLQNVDDGVDNWKTQGIRLSAGMML